MANFMAHALSEDAQQIMKGWTVTHIKDVNKTPDLLFVYTAVTMKMAAIIMQTSKGSPKMSSNVTNAMPR